MNENRHVLKKLFIASFMLGVLSAQNVKAQVTIGSGIPPEKAALLDLKDQVAITAGGVTATRGGAILPRVELVDLNELLPFFQATEIGQEDYEDNQKLAHKGMIVYHIGNDEIATGVYVWSGNNWEIFGTRFPVNPLITYLQCNNASISPSILASGVPYQGIMKVPYTGGNGGDYSGGEDILSSQNLGLTARLQAGTLAYGSGELIYSLTGTPTNDLPAKFQIVFLDQNCEATVSGMILGIGQTITFYGVVTPGEQPAGMTVSSIYPDAVPLLDGLRMDIAWAGGSLPGLARIYNDTNVSQNITYTSTAGAAASVVISPGSFVNVNTSLSWGAAPTETVVNVQVKITDTIYRWYEFKYLGIQSNVGGNLSKVIFMAATRIA